MGRNVTLTLDPAVIEAAKAMADARGMSVSTWLAAKVREEVRAHNQRNYVDWLRTVDAAESRAFDKMAADTAAESWAGSEW
jgi:hypothetical protein